MNSIRIIRGIASASLLAGLAMPVLPVSAAALPQATEQQKAGMHDSLQQEVNELNLTDDQKSKVQVIFDDAKVQRSTIMSDTSLSQDDKKTKMMSLHKDTKAKVMEVLTPEQRTELKAKMEAAKAKSKNPM